MSEIRDNILKRSQKESSTEGKKNFLREELHHLILQELDRKGAFSEICFIGGTALRVLYNLDRFSEDLDFSVTTKRKISFSLQKWTESVVSSLQAYGLDCSVKRLKEDRNVQACYFSFNNLLKDLDPAFQKSQILTIKVDVDTNPPIGAVEMVSPVTGARLYKIRHHDLSSLFAGKLHALLYRMYIKGRDVYDFLWYMGKPNVKVNQTFLQNAIKQTEKKKIKLDNEKLRELLQEKFKRMDLDQAKKDVFPFLQDKNALSLFDKEILINLTQKVELTEN